MITRIVGDVVSSFLGTAIDPTNFGVKEIYSFFIKQGICRSLTRKERPTYLKRKFISHLAERSFMQQTSALESVLKRDRSVILVGLVIFNRRISVQLMNKILSFALVVCFVTSTNIFSAETDHLVTDAPRAQLFEGMGSHTRNITTHSPDAQKYFNQGLAWMHTFNHDEAIRSFARAAQLDTNCAMAWWGISVCEGPNYNAPVMDEDRLAGSWGALQEAQARIGNTSPAERALIEALSKRYAKPWPEDRSHLEKAYADAMAKVWADYPNDSDIGALYAEAMMLERPWKLYSLDRQSTGDTPKILATLERVMELDPGHPGVFHLYVHAVEPSTEPGRALAAADHLRNMMPAAGHMLHMPSHIYIQTAQWDKSIVQNGKAIKSDDTFRTLSPEQTIQNMYMVHNAHMLAFSAMMVGRESEAMEAARKMWTIIPPETLDAVAAFVDRWMSSVYDVQKRFGRWDDILAEPAPPVSMPITTAQWRAHRAIASAAQKDFVGAEREHEEFRKVKAAMPKDSPFGRDMAHKVLDVSDYFVAGEIALQKGEWAKAAELLEKAAAIEDTLSYGEPPQYLQPARHTLGAVYIKAEKFEEAEKVFRKDLKKWPNNGWSLFGLSRSLEAQGKKAEARKVKKDYNECWAKADAPTTTSCVCIQNI